ncbi:hypothetical protein JX266_013996 [Neoarthrinium moseri]|nr:hypothetical protein JX266_013996 [Neoarthrinium moseri]
MWTTLEHVPALAASFIVFQKHTIHVVKRAAKRLQKPSSAILFLHIIIPNIEILSYWVSILKDGQHANPTYVDFLVMAFHSWTSHYLVKEGHYAGHKNIAQPVFHAQMLIRLAISFCSVFLGFPALHAATIKINAAASYPRILIWVASQLKALPTYRDVYTAVMFIGSLLAMHDSGITYGPQIFIGCWVGVYLLESWVARNINIGETMIPKQHPSLSAHMKDCVANFLYHVNFVNQGELQKWRMINGGRLKEQNRHVPYKIE